MNRETQASLCTFRLWLVRTACGLAVGIMTCSHLMAAEATSARNDQLFVRRTNYTGRSYSQG
jgi:hypothetical protein